MRVVIQAFVVVAIVVGLFQPVQGAQAATLQDDVHSLTNSARTGNGLRPLLRDATLDAAAQEWANEMSRMGTMVHSTAEWRAARIPSGWNTHGENIAYGYRSSADVVSAWMDSPGHRENILRTTFTRLGVGYVASGNYWVQIFAGYNGDKLSSFSATPAPSVSGTAREGSVLTATTATWSPAATSSSLQWYSDGVAIPGATGTSYSVTSLDVGARFTVAQTGSRAGYYQERATSAPSAAITSTRTSSRITGNDRFGTSVEISKKMFVSSRPSTVYVSTGLNYPDALAAAPAAAASNAPLLLVAPDHIPAVVDAELRRLSPSRIVILGGETSVSAVVEEKLGGYADSVDRLTGADRFGTSREIARATFMDHGATAYVVTGNNFPDGLLAAAPAARDGAPIIMVNGAADALDAETAALLRDMRTTRVIIVGGLPSVSAGIESGLRRTVTNVRRLTGNDRYGTSAAITRESFSSATSTYLATGTNYPDALAGAVLAADSGAPLMLVPGECLPRETISQLDAMSTRSASLFGGRPSLAEPVERFVACKF